jgi:hypothetical protein
VSLYAAIPGHPHLSSETPILAGMLLDAPEHPVSLMLRRRVDIRPTAYAAPAPQLAIEPTAVHDPPPAWVQMRAAQLEGGR